MDVDVGLHLHKHGPYVPHVSHVPHDVVRQEEDLERVSEGVQATSALEQVNHAKREVMAGPSISLNGGSMKTCLSDAREADFVLG